MSLPKSIKVQFLQDREDRGFDSTGHFKPTTGRGYTLKHGRKMFLKFEAQKLGCALHGASEWSQHLGDIPCAAGGDDLFSFSCRVCRQWRRVARDNRIWRHVNLLPYKLNLQKTWKLIRAHFSDVLLSLRLKGYLDPGQSVRTFGQGVAALGFTPRAVWPGRCPCCIGIHTTHYSMGVLGRKPKLLFGVMLVLSLWDPSNILHDRRLHGLLCFALKFNTPIILFCRSRKLFMGGAVLSEFGHTVLQSITIGESNFGISPTKCRASLAAGVSWKKATLSDAMLRDLLERCPNMVTLQLHQTNLTNVAIDNLPTRLTTLIITHSLVKPGWFKALTTKENILSSLEHVGLSHSSKTSNLDLGHLCSRPSIKTLKLTGCYRITDEGFQNMAEKLTNITTLHLEKTSCTDLAIHHICRHQRGLLVLNLSECKHITDGALGSLASGLKQLNWLSIARCTQLTADGVKQLSSVKSLKHLDLSGIPLGDEHIQELKGKLPGCQILS